MATDQKHSSNSTPSEQNAGAYRAKESIKSTYASSSSEETSEESDSDYALRKASIGPKKKIHKVNSGKAMCMKKNSGNKNAKPRRNLTRGHLPGQDLNHASNINDIWERDVNLERTKRIILTNFLFEIDTEPNANFINISNNTSKVPFFPQICSHGNQSPTSDEIHEYDTEKLIEYLQT
ncbi:23752_t:CDS:2, partial [Gigaspora rosea]